MKFYKSIFVAALAVMSLAACKDSKKDNMDDNGDSMSMDSTAMDKDANKDMNDQDNMDNNSDMMDSNSKDNFNLAQVAMGDKDLSTLVTGMQNAGMVAKLKTEGPFTIFAPTNSAFNDLPKGTMENLMKPENKDKLEGIISYHIIPGNVDAAKLKDLIKSHDGTYELVTANDGKLEATMNDAGNIILTDGKGDKATVVDADMKGSNGVIHSINAVMMRK